MNTVASIKTRDNGSPVVEEQVKVEIISLPIAKESIDYLYVYFSSPEIVASSASGMSGNFIYRFTESFLTGMSICYVPVVDNMVFAGLFYGNYVGKDRLDCHQGIFNQFKGLGMKTIALCCHKVFKETKVRQLVGYVPCDNRASLFCATHGAGFRIVGKMPNYYQNGDVFTDAWMIIKERDHGH